MNREGRPESKVSQFRRPRFGRNLPEKVRLGRWLEVLGFRRHGTDHLGCLGRGKIPEIEERREMRVLEDPEVLL